MGDALYEAAKIWVDTESQGVPWYVLYSCVNKACVHSHFVLSWSPGSNISKCFSKCLEPFFSKDFYYYWSSLKNLTEIAIISIKYVEPNVLILLDGDYFPSKGVANKMAIHMCVLVGQSIDHEVSICNTLD